MGWLSAHVLDTAHGAPAQDVTINLHVLGADNAWRQWKQVRSNTDGRTDQPLLIGSEAKVGTYMLTFHIGDYFKRRGLESSEPPFLDLVPLRFSIAQRPAKLRLATPRSPWLPAPRSLRCATGPEEMRRWD